MEALPSLSTGGHTNVESLFLVVDQTFNRAPEEAQAVLEDIVELSPRNGRAQRLLASLVTSNVGPYDFRIEAVSDPLQTVMEAAETLAAEGLDEKALEVVKYVERKYSRSPEAKVWLQGVKLLLD